MPRPHELEKRILDQMAYIINLNPYAISLSPRSHSLFLAIDHVRRAAHSLCWPTASVRHPIFVCHAYYTQYPYLYAMCIITEASTRYDMLITLYFSIIPYPYAVHPISVCRASHIRMPCIPYPYANMAASHCHICCYASRKSLKSENRENSFYTREVLAAAFWEKINQSKKSVPRPYRLYPRIGILLYL